MKRLALSVVLLYSIFISGYVSGGAEYYETVDISSSQAMRDSLHEIIDDHTRYPYR